MGKLLGIEQSEVSKLKKGQFSRFGLERLLYFLEKLHYNVDIKLSPAKGTKTYQRVMLGDMQQESLNFIPLQKLKKVKLNQGFSSKNFKKNCLIYSSSK